MNCEELHQLSVSDEPADQDALVRHASGCAQCATLLQTNRRLAAEVEAWRAASPAPPHHLEERILAAARGSATSSVAAFPTRPAVAKPASRPGRWRWALASAAVLGSMVFALALVQQLGPSDRGLPQAVREVRKAERAYTRAIAALEQQAATSLARMDDPGLAGEQAVILLTYRDRLANLDAVIAEVQGFLGENPGHSGGHTVLLAAYKEKSEVLQEVIDLQLGEVS
jgi:hypothetical protein